MRRSCRWPVRSDSVAKGEDSDPNHPPPPLSLVGQSRSTRIHPEIKPKIISTPLKSKAAPSKIIPMPESHIHRTTSEQDMTEVAALAEMHDAHMFNRLIYGMERRNQERNINAALNNNKKHHLSLDLYLCVQRNNRTVASILRSRNTDLGDLDHQERRMYRSKEEESTSRPTFQPTISEKTHHAYANLLEMAYQIADEGALKSSSSSESNQLKQDLDHEGIFIMDDDLLD